MTTNRAQENRVECWKEAVAALDRISPEVVAAIRSGNAAAVRGLNDRGISFVCALALTALGEAHYLRSEVLREKGKGQDIDPLPVRDEPAAAPTPTTTCS